MWSKRPFPDTLVSIVVVDIDMRIHISEKHISFHSCIYHLFTHLHHITQVIHLCRSNSDVYYIMREYEHF